jgi:hypothetical protein
MRVTSLSDLVQHTPDKIVKMDDFSYYSTQAFSGTNTTCAVSER